MLALILGHHHRGDADLAGRRRCAAFAAFWTEIARNTPLTLVFFFIAFVLPHARRPAAVRRSSRSSRSTYYTSPFVAEALRSGINSVPVGQAEAARSIGLGFGQTVSLVVLPQAFRMTIPPLINVFIALTKNTSVAGGFFVVELFATTAAAGERQRQHRARRSSSRRPRSYLVITVPLGCSPGSSRSGGWWRDERSASSTTCPGPGRVALANPSILALC